MFKDHYKIISLIGLIPLLLFLGACVRNVKLNYGKKRYVVQDRHTGAICKKRASHIYHDEVRDFYVEPCNIMIIRKTNED